MSLLFSDTRTRSPEQAIAELESIYSTAPVGLCFTDLDHRYVRINERLAAINGLPAADHIGRRVDEVLPSPLAEEVIASSQKVIDTGRPSIEREMAGQTRADPEPRIYLISRIPIRDGGGKIVGVNSVIQDITRLRRMEAGLLPLEARIEDAARSTRMLVYEAAVDKGEILALHGEFELIGEEAPQRPVPMDWWASRVHPDDLKRCRGAIEHAARGAQSYNLQYRVRQADASYLHVHEFGTVVPAAGGQPRRIIGTIVDITRHKEAEQALRLSEERLNLIAENVPYGSWMCNELGENTYVTQSFLDMVGRTYDEIGKFGWIDLVHPEDADELKAQWQHCVETGEDWDYTYRIRAHDGRWVTLLTLGRPIRNPDGDIISWVGIHLDITERQRAEAELAESRERLLAALDASMTGTWRWNCRTDELVWDEALKQVYGLPPDYEIKCIADFVRFVHPDDLESVQAFVERATNSCSDFEVEMRIIRPDGAIRWITDKGRTIPGPDGKALYMTGACMDTTDYKKTERQLRDLTASLELRIEERTEAINRYAAQLRRLAAELTRAEQVERRRLAEFLHNHLQQIVAAALMRVQRLRKFGLEPKVTDILKQSEGLLLQAIEEARTLTTEISPPILHHGTLNEALNWLARIKREKYDLNVVIDCEPGIEIAAEEIRIFLFETIRELLFNVFKHSNTDTVTITARRVEGEMIRVIVQDHGAGCPAERLKDLKAGDEEGFGLFSISERAEFFGGRVFYTSAPGEGFKTEMLLPGWIEEASPKTNGGTNPETAVESAARSEIRRKADRNLIQVVVADDHKIVREGLISLLSDEEDLLLIGEAATGLQALEQIHALRPHVIVMDVNMPDMNGIEATRRIRAEYPGVQVIGLSVNDDDDTREAMLSAGATHYLQKDGPAEALVAAIRQCRKSEGETARGVS